MRQHHALDLGRGDRERLPVLQAQLFQALEESAVDQQATVPVRQQVLRPGHRAGCAQERQLHAPVLSSEGQGGGPGSGLSRQEGGPMNGRERPKPAAP